MHMAILTGMCILTAMNISDGMEDNIDHRR